MYNIAKLSIGRELKKYRKIKHLSLEYVGEKIGKSKATISKYENDEIVPDFITILEICNILEIKLEEIFPSITEVYKIQNPFKTTTLYLYYLTGKKLINSTIKLGDDKSKPYHVELYNGIRNNKCAYFYTGTFELSEYVLYINLKNLNSSNLSIERVQIIVSLPLSNSTNSFNCFITGLTPNFVPTIKRGIITLKPFKLTEQNIKKLRVSKEELKEISLNNSWILNTKLYDESFYDYDI